MSRCFPCDRLDPALCASDGYMMRDGAEWVVHVLDDPSPGAFVTPGGYIFVHRGLIEMCRADANELASVLAHEMAHQLARHSSERMSHWKLVVLNQSFIWTTMTLMGTDSLAALGGGWMAAVTVPAIEAMEQWVFLLPYSREHEREADAVGMDLLSRACFDPRGAPRFMRKLELFEERAERWAEQQEQQRQGGGVEAAAAKSDGGAAAKRQKKLQSYLATHPPTADRVAALTSKLDKAKQRYNDCGCLDYRKKVDVSINSGRLPANDHPENKGKVTLSTRAQREEFLRRSQGVEGEGGGKGDGGSAAQTDAAAPSASGACLWPEGEPFERVFERRLFNRGARRAVRQITSAGFHSIHRGGM